VAIGIVALVVGQFAVRTAISYDVGITENDSIQYHLPFAARFVQSGSITHLHFVRPGFPDTFHPANNELLHGFGMALFGRDVASPMLNMVWVVAALLAAWCIGRRYGVPAATVAAAAVVLASPLAALRGAGTGGNDIAVLFFVLAAVALLVQSEGDGMALALRSRSDVTAVVLSAIALGLGVGTKLTLVVPATALLIGGAVVTPRGARRRLWAVWFLPAVAAGAFWYVRNWARSGSPIPSLNLGAGPLPFPTPRFEVLERLGFSVLHYARDGRILREWFVPGLRLDLGPAWWLTLGLAVAGGVAALVFGRRPFLRMLGAVALVSAAGYAVTPTGALGPAGQPLLFASNFIYAAPALVLALVSLPLVPALRVSARPTVVLVLLLGALVVSQTARALPAWPTRHLAVGIVVAALTAALGALAALRPPARSVALAAAVTAFVIAGLGGFFVSHAYVRDRYRFDVLGRRAKTLDHARIAIAGFPAQYPLYGDRLTNTVQYVGSPGPHGEFHPSKDCTAWRGALRSGRFGYVILRPATAVIGMGDISQRELVWTTSDPGAHEIGRSGEYTVFAFDPAVPDPGCG